MKAITHLSAGCGLAVALLATAFAPLAWAGSGNGNNCSFQAKGLSLAFGTLNPASGSTVTVGMTAATLYADKVGDCAQGQRMVLSADNGLYYNGSLRLKKLGSNDYIPYSLSFPTNLTGQGVGNYVSFGFNGIVLPADYANAPAGSYSDNVLISVSP